MPEFKKGKRCPKCSGNGPFTKDKARKDGLACWCVNCNKQYREENRERLNAYKREWAKQNMTPTRKARYRENWKRGYWEKYREAHLKRSKRNYQNLDDFTKKCRRAVSKLNANAKQRGQKGKVNIRQITDLLSNPICNHEGCVETANLEIDHVIPACFGGPNLLNNLQLLCPKHHREKSSEEQSALAGKQKDAKTKELKQKRQLDLF